MGHFSRAARRAALQWVVSLQQERGELLKNAPIAADPADYENPETEAGKFMEQLKRLDRELSTALNYGPQGEVDWMDRLAAFALSRNRDFFFAMLACCLILLIGYLFATGELGQRLSFFIYQGWAIAQAAAQDAHVLLEPENLKPLLVMWCAVMLSIVLFVVVGVWIFSGNVDKARDAREFLQTIVVFLVGVLAGRVI